jgi:hypothetical protein
MKHVIRKTTADGRKSGVFFACSVDGEIMFYRARNIPPGQAGRVLIEEEDPALLEPLLSKIKNERRKGANTYEIVPLALAQPLDPAGEQTEEDSRA